MECAKRACRGCSPVPGSCRLLRDLKMGMVVLSGAKTWLDVLVMARGRGRMGVWEGGPEGNVEEKDTAGCAARLYYRPLAFHAEIDEVSRDVMSGASIPRPALPALLRAASRPSMPSARLRPRPSPRCCQRRPRRGRRSGRERQRRASFRPMHPARPPCKTACRLLRARHAAPRTQRIPLSFPAVFQPQGVHAPTFQVLLGSSNQADPRLHSSTLLRSLPLLRLLPPARGASRYYVLKIVLAGRHLLRLVRSICATGRTARLVDTDTLESLSY